ncbi:MAG: bifunctional diguanylate cyclase/phosphodiesterase [Gammaproteobacteria bacterium]|nr:bifunctional diguanylate cyclase/phosphodiesterase [Gammaproteobacteria bacterium]MCP5202524.1 bifunctional diguanylate cyclase/phosphodiesterase [Gammaproteobacteria bacterium]
MNRDSLRDFDLLPYADLLGSVCGAGAELRFETLEGELLASSVAVATPVDATLVDLGEALADGVSHWSDGADRAALRTCVSHGAAAEPLWLSLLLPPARPADDHLAEVFRRVAALVESDLGKSEVLEGMSQELATRYEELNFVYELDHRQIGNPARVRDALHELAETTRAHLDLDLVLFYVPDQDTCLDARTALIELDEDEARLVARAMLDYLNTDPTTLVLNRDDVIDWLQSDIAADYKLCATPIRIEGQRTVGLLLFARPLARPHFTNSDRRMCEVVATEVAKLLQHSRDHLTGALNRRGIEALIDDCIGTAAEDAAVRALLVLDIDNFQVLNNQVGMSTADDLLRHVAQILPRLDAETSPRVGRLGADEFALVVELPTRAAVEAFGARICQTMRQLGFFHQGQALEIGVSIGGSLIDAETADSEAVFTIADIALREAKSLGGGVAVVHGAGDAAINEQREQLDVVGLLRRALKGAGLELFAQAIVPAGDAGDEVPYMEVLVRLRAGDGTLVSPGVFIPVAEAYRLMPELDRWIIEHTIAALGAHFGRGGRALRAAVNVSGQSMGMAGLADNILGWLAHYGVPATALCVEVTETAAVANLTHGFEMLARLREAGCRIALDDFGSGMSSFGYLRSLPVDVVKIDGSFVKRMTSSTFDRTFVDVINRLAHALGLKTVAEFVEDQATRAMLRDLRVDYLQGYLFDKPGPLAVKIAGLAADPTELARAG